MCAGMRRPVRIYGRVPVLVGDCEAHGEAKGSRVIDRIM